MVPEPEWIEVSEGTTTWRVDRGFLTSSWTCLWRNGCQGILDRPAPELEQGCCSEGAAFADADEALRIDALARTLDPDLFQFAAEAESGGVFSSADRVATRVVDGACIFFNRPGFAGGVGCALHLDALATGQSPIETKPIVCWQLPVRAVESGSTVTVRRWSRDDWGPDAALAWCCTEAPEAYVGDGRLIDTMADEIEAVVGTEVFVELRRALEA